MSEFDTLEVEGRVFDVSLHALVRLSARGVSLAQVATAIREGEHFRYAHDGSWKDGYHHSPTRTFVGVADDTIVTVIANVRPRYIDNLKAGGT